MERKARVELLTPDLDAGIMFFPGYDLAESRSLSPEQLAGIALTLWDLSGTDSCQSTSSPWRATQLTENWEGGG